MDRNVLLVFNRNKESLVDDIRDIFDERVFVDGLEGIIDQEASLSKAQRRLELRNYDLLIVDLHVPADSMSASEAEDQMGFDWVKELHANDLGVPSIIVTTAPDELLSHKASKLAACQTLSLGEHFSELLAEKSHDALTGQSVKGGISLDLEIYLKDNLNQPGFKIRGTIDNEVINRDGVLEIDPELIQELRDRCNQNIPNLPKEIWEDEFKRIGQNLFKEFFGKNRKLSNPLYKFMSKIDPEKQFLFRFRVGKDIHSLVLESLFENEENVFWMLRYPIIRQIDISGDYHQLFIGRPDRGQRLNCLIINSDVHEYVDQLNRSFPQLSNIKKESDFLCEFLETNKRKLKIGKITPIDGPGHDITFADTIRSVLSEEKYHLVHYAGHTYYDAERMKGYLILPGHDYPEVLDIELLGAWLRKAKTQFVFLSSCHSSEEDFVFELARKKIPAILGFRWDLDDERAFEYARSFYLQLFEKKNRLEYALLEARKEMYTAHRQDRIWAAPMLVLQTSSWQ